jgi:hypothetical protein
VPERQLANIVEQYALERDDLHPDLLLRSVADPWPFPPHARVVPAVVAAVDLREASGRDLAVLGAARLEQLAREVVADWRQRPPRRRPVRPIVPSGAAPELERGVRRSSVAEELRDERVELDAEQPDCRGSTLRGLRTTRLSGHHRGVPAALRAGLAGRVAAATESGTPGRDGPAGGAYRGGLSEAMITQVPHGCPTA